MNRQIDFLNGIGCIEGITIINVEGEILFSAKFNNKFAATEENYEVVGKKFLDIYENLDENTSTIYEAMRKGIPVYCEDQILKAVGRSEIKINSLSFPIKSNGIIVGAIDLSVTNTFSEETEGHVDLALDSMKEEILYGYNNVESLSGHGDAAKYTVDDIQTCDRKMLTIKDNLQKLAKTDFPVMIYGETGTGKELVAHALHNASPRASKPFVVQNCGSIPANLMESILFGTSKGAFTGAVDNIGLLEHADGGTLFLDEINSMPLEIQPKLLRVVQDGTFRKVGDREVRKVDVRIISSTNERPEDIVADGKLRSDLYYRLSVLNLEIPPLRERKKDIPLLTNYLVMKYNKVLGKNIHKISKKVYESLAECAWKGNVRELENVIAFGVSMTDPADESFELSAIKSRLDRSVEPADSVALEHENSLADMVSGYEKRIIRSALDETGGNITKAAELLNIPRQTLSRKVKDYGL